MERLALTLAVTTMLAACGGGDAEPADEAAPSEEAAPAAQPAPSGDAPERPGGPLTMPDWYQHDAAANTVNLTVVAGETPVANYWNYNGFIKGEIDITVPEGATVTIDFTNNDPVMAHSIGISDKLSDFSVPPEAVPVFEGAISESPLSMIEGGLPGSTETISFVADQAGEYSMVCYVPGHTAVGMWLFFTVSADGEAGVRGL